MAEWMKNQKKLIEEVLEFNKDLQKLQKSPDQAKIKEIRNKCSEIEIVKFRLGTAVTDEDLIGQISNFAQGFNSLAVK